MRRLVLSFVAGTIIGVLGGLIGLGGAEFRLPILAGWFEFSMLSAIIINQIISLVTVFFSLIFRLSSQGIEILLEQLSVAINILTGSFIGSYIGVDFAVRVSERTLTIIVTIILAILGCILIAHELIFSNFVLEIPNFLRIILGFVAGFIIGIVSSLLGVAGGELIIPTLILLFALDIKTAGTVSLMISIPTLFVGIWRYRKKAKFAEIYTERFFIVTMATGSVLGARLGALLLLKISGIIIQTVLGTILVFSSAKLAYSKLYKNQPVEKPTR